MSKLLLASKNPGKLREMKALLEGVNVDLVSPAELGLDLVIKEEGSTYAENAAHKALVYAERSGLVALADDSGLEVDALDGAPGLYSARYAPQPGATDADRRAYLLQQIRGNPRPWTARFRCTIAVATPSAEVHCREGICPGEIIPEERGHGGFGYDPIFLIPELGRTMAELDLDEKNRLSHRAQAVQAAIPLLRKLIDL
ncbi:MAG TPA: RdgB/HAM1 family non-canonical purine NTP pyrophosphatase [Anaerolineales bacterium]|nr:RdgB/HAM1 family non-canonical purine NTP pyrophosphatase [Anaerolineales bacterium]